jgi:hypothetical protein
MSHESSLSWQALSLQRLKSQCSPLSVTFVPVALIACSLVSGCISYQYTSYPYHWSKPAADRFGECPRISGRYKDKAAEMTKIPSGDRRPAREDASPFLAVNLVGGFSDAWRWWQWVDIEQLDDQSLTVTLGPGSEPIKYVLHRASDDFSCEDGKLYISGPSESLFKGKTEGTTALMTTLGIGVGTGGVRLQRGAFSRTMKGDLVMEAQRSAVGVVLFYLPNISAHTYYLRWEPYLPPEAAPAEVR